jgi:hypothetical protein
MCSRMCWQQTRCVWEGAWLDDGERPVLLPQLGTAACCCGCRPQQVTSTVLRCAAGSQLQPSLAAVLAALPRVLPPLRAHRCVCLPPASDACPAGFPLRTPQVGLDVWLRDGNVFHCWSSMWDVIWHGELGSSLALLKAGEWGPVAGWWAGWG